MTLDRAGLAEFVDRDEGDEPPVFVGRDPVFADILATADRSWMDRDGVQGRAKDTRIIQGAPGAGKSTILAELAARTRAGGGGTGSIRTEVLTLSSGRIRGPIDILGPLAALVDAAAAKDFLTRYQTTSSRGAHLGAFGSSIGVERATTTTSYAPEPTLTAFHDWVRDSTGGLPGPIIIAIDEAQNMRFGNDDPRTSLLRCIHEADPPLPFTLVLAGLGDTDTRATDMGLTRGKMLHTIGALDPNEVTDLTHRWCGHFGLDPTGHADALAALAGPCEGWPRHLHFALQALGRDILRTQDAGPGALAAVDWERVATAAAFSRLNYYRGQQRGAMAACAALVGAVLDDLGAAAAPSLLRRSHVINGLHRHTLAHPDASAWQIPKGMDADSLADHLFHRGVLQETPDGSLTCPIPSFRSYLVREAARVEVGTLLAGDQGPSPVDREADRILAATEPHTEDEIARWTALASTWRRHCGALATIAGDTACLATVKGAPTDTDRARATTVLATLDADGTTPPAAGVVPDLPHSLPHAERAAAALEGMIDTVRDAARAIRDGEADPWRADTLGAVVNLPEEAVAASPEEQLAWALEHLTGAPPEAPEDSSPSMDP